MDPKAIIKAQSRLRIAQKAIEELARCKDFDEFTDAWHTFLTASKGIYTTLEQGAKVSAKSRQWFGAKKKIRRNDQLLQYIFQARDDDLHGLSPVAEHVPGSLAIGVNKPGFSSSMTIDGTFGPGGSLKVTSLDDKPVLIEQIFAHVRLNRVHDRGKRPYDPPVKHLGVKLPSNMPLPVATLSISYFRTLISEAEKLE